MGPEVEGLHVPTHCIGLPSPSDWMQKLTYPRPSASDRSKFRGYPDSLAGPTLWHTWGTGPVYHSLLISFPSQPHFPNDSGKDYFLKHFHEVLFPCPSYEEGLATGRWGSLQCLLINRAGALLFCRLSKELIESQHFSLWTAGMTAAVLPGL